MLRLGLTVLVWALAALVVLHVAAYGLELVLTFRLLLA